MVIIPFLSISLGGLNSSVYFSSDSKSNTQPGVYDDTA